MDFSSSERSLDLAQRVRAFIDTEIEPAERVIAADIAARRAAGEDPWPAHPLLAELQGKAREQGLWNLFLPAGHEGPYAAQFGTDGGTGLSNSDYAPIAEAMGRSFSAPLVFNCNAPDTGNMEVLLKYGTDEQKSQWLEPLLDGRIRSAFLMTEPGVASSDATNMEATAVIDGDEVVLNGTQVVVHRSGQPRLQGRDLHGRHRPRGIPARPALDGRRARSTTPASRSSGCCRPWVTTTSRSGTARSR